MWESNCETKSARAMLRKETEGGGDFYVENGEREDEEGERRR